MDPDIWKPELYMSASPAPPVDKAIIAATAISSTLSILGSGLIIITYIAFKDLRTKARELLVFLSMADFLTASSYLYGTLRNYHSSTWDCVAQSAVSTFSNLSSFLWTICISVYIYALIVKSDKTQASRMVTGFHVLCWGMPAAVVIVAVTQGGLGYDASYISVGWCWVNIRNHFFLVWMLVGGKIWEIFSYIFLPLMYFLVKRHIHVQTRQFHELPPHRQQTVQLMARVDTKLTLIPLVFILLRVWSTVRFMLYVTRSHLVTNSILLCLHGIGNTFQGAANCILFCLMTARVRHRLLATLCCCKSSKEEKERSPLIRHPNSALLR